MSHFRTILPIEKAAVELSYHSPMLCIGSCFTENIGQLLKLYKLPVILNPFGILYNPISIKNNLELLLSDNFFTADDLIFNKDLYHSFAHHSLFSQPTQQLTLDKINNTLKHARQQLQQTKRLIITFGTARVFVHKSTAKIVANCHKLPNTEFEKYRLSAEEIQTAFQRLLKKYKRLIPNLEVLFTVSPIRHIRDGLLANQRSKAVLLLAIEALEKQFDFVHYFPAYELVLDDLRDYRFYKQDLIHPNEIAIQYIWENFQKSYFSDDTLTILNQVKKVIQASQHRPFHIQTAAHQQFLTQQLQKLDVLKKRYPFLNFDQERQQFLEQTNV